MTAGLVIGGPAPFVCPTEAAAAGFTRLVREGTYRHPAIDLDTTNSKAAGFKDYLSAAWPNAAGDFSGQTGQTWHTFSDQSMSHMEFRNNGSLFSFTGSNAQGLNNTTTACYNAGLGSVGDWFGPGGFYEYKLRFFNASGFDQVGAYMFGKKFLTGLSAHPVEIDIFGPETSTTAHQKIIVWDLSSSTWVQGTGTQDIGSLPWLPGETHTVGFRHRTKAMNSGVGELKWYLDHVLTMTITYTTEPMSIMDDDQFAMFWSNSGSNPTELIYKNHWHLPL